MKDFQPSEIRNVVLLGHSGVGKTSAAEGMLFAAGVSKRLGQVDDGTSVLDYGADEVERKITINLGLAGFSWGKVKVNLIDTPGYPDFYGDVAASIRIADLILLTIRSDAGVEVGTEKVWSMASQRGLPCMVLVNRMDREHADFSSAVGQVNDRLNCRAIPLYLPLGEGDSFTGLIDPLAGKVYRYQADGSGNFATEDIPAEDKDRADEGRAALVEAAAEADDALLERYLEGEDLSDEEIGRALKDVVREGKLVPCVPVSHATNIGFSQLLDAVERLSPSPAAGGELAVDVPGGGEATRAVTHEAPMVSLVFKTISEPHVGDLSLLRVYSGVLQAGSEVRNSSREDAEKIGQLFRLIGKERHEVSELKAGDFGAAVKLRKTSTGDTLCDPGNQAVLEPIGFPHPHISVAIEPKSKGDEDKIGNGLARLQEEDPTFQVTVDPDIRQTIIAGLGELHLEVAVERLRRRFGVEVEMTRPRIPYRETIKGQAEVQGKYKKQTGGRGQYGDVWIRLEPQGRGEGFVFHDKVVGGSVPNKFIPAVEKGIREAMAEGVLAGCQVVDLAATLYDGSFHPVDSSEMAFKVAGSMAFKKAFMEAKPMLLEPIYEVKVTVPDENLGDVMGDLSGRRGKILGVDSQGPVQVVKAQVPLAELWKYSTLLRSLTQGRGMHELSYSHYEEVPREIAEKLIAEAEAEKK